MKSKILIFKLLVPACLIFMLSGCYKLQEDYNRTPHTINPHTGMTAWQFMNSRSYIKVVDTIINGTTKTLDTVTIKYLDILKVPIATAITNARLVTAAKPNFPAGATVSTTVRTVKVDTIFTLMLRLIRASGIDTSLYTQTNTNRTFILLHQDAIRRLNKTSSVYNDCFVGAILVNGSVGTVVSSKYVAPNWNVYPKVFLQNYLKWLILDGVYDHYTLKTPYNVEVKTLADPGYFANLPATISQPGTSATLITGQSAGSATIPAFAPGLNPNSTMKIRVLNSSPSNTSDYPIVLNSAINVRTSSILLTNGTAHVVDRYFTTNIPTVDF